MCLFLKRDQQPERAKKIYVLIGALTGELLARNEEQIRAEAALDGLDVVRSSVARKQMDSDRVVAYNNSTAKVERAFRCLKTVALPQPPSDSRIRFKIWFAFAYDMALRNMRRTTRRPIRRLLEMRKTTVDENANAAPDCHLVHQAFAPAIQILDLLNFGLDGIRYCIWTNRHDL